MDRTPQQGDIYRHFKNKMYQIVGIAIHSETREKLVVYQALYGDYSMYVRPLEMFVSEVDHEKYPDVTQKYRFEKVDRSTLTPQTTEVAKSVAATQSVEVVQTTEVPKPAEAALSQKTNYANMSLEERFDLFLDSDDYEEKYKILMSMDGEITDRMIDNLAVIMDVTIPDGATAKRYDDLLYALRTRGRFETGSRLR